MNVRNIRDDGKGREKEEASLGVFREILRIFKSLLSDGDIKLNFSPRGCSTVIKSDRIDDELVSSEIDKKKTKI